MKQLLEDRGSLRFRLTASAAVAVAVVLCTGGLALALIQRAQLTANLDDSLEQRADSFAASLIADPPAGPLPATIPSSSSEDRAIQLVGDNGTVLAATSNVSGGPLGPQPLGDRLQAIQTITLPQIEDDEYRLLSRNIELANGPATLHVAQNIDDLNDAIRGLAVSLALTIPLVVGAMATLAWWLVGRTLRPVEAIRAEVAHISGTDLHRRVPVTTHADEIAELAETMNEMLDRVEASHQKQRQFIADASHELRTPLTRLRTEIEVDVVQPDAADSVATSRVVLEEAKGLQQLLDDLLYLARLDENSIEQRREPVDLDDLVLAEAASARLESDRTIDTSEVSAAHVHGDQQQLRRLIRNLLNNAVRHAAQKVAIELRESDDEIILAVSDDGAGVPVEARTRIFERFGRADDARSRAAGGSGLGLSIARDIVDRHEGTIAYDSGQRTGARFVVSIPRVG